MAITPQKQIDKKAKSGIYSSIQEIEITSHHSFAPKQIKIKTGMIVRWHNESGETHTITLDPKLVKNAKNCALPKKAETFDSGPIRPGNQFDHQFVVPGRYTYFCKIHEQMGMTGDIIVED